MACEVMETVNVLKYSRKPLGSCDFGRTAVQRLFSTDSPFKLGFQPQITVNSKGEREFQFWSSLLEIHCVVRVHLVANTTFDKQRPVGLLIRFQFGSQRCELLRKTFCRLERRAWLEKPTYWWSRRAFWNCSQCVSERIPHFEMNSLFGSSQPFSQLDSLARTQSRKHFKTLSKHSLRTLFEHSKTICSERSH